MHAVGGLFISGSALTSERPTDIHVLRMEKRVDCISIDRGPLGYIYKRPPNPRLEGYDYTTLNTPPQMQRECNVVAFEEWY